MEVIHFRMNCNVVSTQRVLLYFARPSYSKNDKNKKRKTKTQQTNGLWVLI